ncbi:MAG TPA: DUF4118 domain-containing protein [Ktedonobacteraceae bacterium]|nr:DUF4118 domain-containing protein [Ktedonobacteraceae bacterium]
MEQTQHRSMSQAKQDIRWKRALIDVGLAIIAVVLVTLIIYGLRLHTYISTVLFVYLFIVLWLVHQRGFWIAVFAAFAACLAFDFFLIQPVFSFTIDHFDDALALFIFLLFAIILGFLYSKMQEIRRQEHEESILFKQRLHQQAEEVTRHDYEAGIFYNVVQATRDEKDLKYQLGLISLAIEEAFSFCGVRSCVILVPDHNGRLAMQRLPSQANTLTELTPDEEGSVAWVMQQGKSVKLPNIPLISRAKGSYLRRVVASSTTNSQVAQGYSCLVPLLSGKKVLGVLRLLVEDNAHPRLMTIKRALETEQSASDVHAELFAKLKDYAVSLIKEALIERALMQEESLRQELSSRK